LSLLRYLSKSICAGRCGLRHKAGKLHSVPLPSPPQRRNPAAAAGINGSTNPSRTGSRGNPAAAAGGIGYPSAVEQEVTLAAAADAAARAGLPASSAAVLARVMGQQLLADQGYQRSSLAASAAVAAAAAFPDGNHSHQQRPHDLASLAGLVGIKIEDLSTPAAAAAAGANGLTDAMLASAAAAAAAAAEGGPDGLTGVVPDRLSLVGPSGFATPPLAAAAAAAAAETQQQQQAVPLGLPDFTGMIEGSNSVTRPVAAAGLPDIGTQPRTAGAAALSAAAAAAAERAGLAIDLGLSSSELPNMSAQMAAFLGRAMAGEEAAPKRRRTKKPAVPGSSAIGAGGGLGVSRSNSRPVGASAAVAAALVAGGQQQQQLGGLLRDDSLAAAGAVAAADALLALNRSR
jgi:hypothetical protein